MTDFAYEATIRGKTGSGEHLLPSVLFRTTEKEQVLLDRQARMVAIREAVPLVKDSLLFLNCHPLSLQTEFVFEDVANLGVPIHQLVLEITEQSPIVYTASLQRLLTSLRNRGLKIAIDDFGTGYSNLWLVEALEPDYIKLDRSMIRNVDRTDYTRRVIEGMVAFAEKVQTKLIAEGIERESQKDILRELGVPYGQGYFFGYPAAARSFEGKGM